MEVWLAIEKWSLPVLGTLMGARWNGVSVDTRDNKHPSTPDLNLECISTSIDQRDKARFVHSTSSEIELLNSIKLEEHHAERVHNQEHCHMGSQYVYQSLISGSTWERHLWCLTHKKQEKRINVHSHTFCGEESPLEFGYILRQESDYGNVWVPEQWRLDA